VTIRELAERVRHLTGSHSTIVTIPYEQAFGPGFEDIRHRVPDVGKLRRMIGAVPATDLDVIIERIIEFVRQRPDPHLAEARA
jgi:UDP-glucose 4-epimerase